MADSTPDDASNSGDSPVAPLGDAASSLNVPQENEETLVGAVPPFTQGLLKVQVPVQVTLASQRKSIHEILELGPGSIVKFDKTCDAPLELCVGDRLIAWGEVVKVGDKFGVRIGERNWR